jgi:hypothetical protein
MSQPTGSQIQIFYVMNTQDLTYHIFIYVRKLIKARFIIGFTQFRITIATKF